MKLLNIKPSWLFFLIPIGLITFVLFPEIQQTYTTYDNKQVVLQQDVFTLDSLKQLTAPGTKDLHTIKRLELTIPVHKMAYKREAFLYYKTGGMLAILLFMGIGMFATSYISNKRKTSFKNKTIDFSFENPNDNPIGKRVSWEPLESSGSNFSSEVLKKTVTGYKVTSSSFTKVFAWSFFLVGLNYIVVSFIEYTQTTDIPLTFMKGGKLFFTSGGPFLIIGFILILMFSSKVVINTRKRKVIINGEILSFDQIFALQVLEKFIEGSSSGSYFCYELNLITQNGDRHNLLNHGDKDYILSDMVKISRFFNVLVWNKGIV
jgi:flagellar biogenesis protein FliO